VPEEIKEELVLKVHKDQEGLKEVKDQQEVKDLAVIRER
jgi:hypothetical protein